MGARPRHLEGCPPFLLTVPPWAASCYDLALHVGSRGSGSWGLRPKVKELLRGGRCVQIQAPDSGLLLGVGGGDDREAIGW